MDLASFIIITLMIIIPINEHHMNYPGFFSHQIGLKRAHKFRLGKYIVLASPECLYFDFSVNKPRSPTKVDVTEALWLALLGDLVIVAPKIILREKGIFEIYSSWWQF